ncbi:Fe(2+) transporter permease subunit FeoB [candidate division WOR-3 bacterium]|nr:Fe(2+) transporter permease subunit FeoB [candidate division WOR-3 bacterium]
MNDTIAIVGNPNCGKSTLFNGLTGGNIKTGNWPGVTVEKREGSFKKDKIAVTVVDLPGIYSFSAHSEDEKIARDYILSGESNIIINIVDATNLERNLYLTTQLIEMKIPVLLVLNMMDLAEKQKMEIDIKGLSKLLDLPVMAISAVQQDDIAKVKIEVMKRISDPKVSNVEVEYPNEVESVISKWQEKTTKTSMAMSIDSRWIALKLMENDAWLKRKVFENDGFTEREILKEQSNIENILKDTPDVICADHRYGFIHGISKKVLKRAEPQTTFTERIDGIVLSRFWGIPVFLAAMLVVFWTTITIGGAFIDFFDILFGTVFVDGLGTVLDKIGTPSLLTTFLANGVGGGIQIVSTFVPIIFFMFLMLSILEDSGYMARAAFVMDRFLRFIGLPGKSFIPLLIGFGCTVPAVMATRTLESKKDKFLTIFMTPFMSCGARLPVYALFVSVFFQKNGGLVVFSLYITGIIIAILTGLLLKKTLFRGEVSYLIMELPPYHRPRFRHILLHTWEKLKGFLLRAGQVIVLVVIVLSLLNSLGTDGSIGNENSEKSILAAVGKFLTPVFQPIGIEQKNWPATVGIFTGLFAKEAVVGALNSLYEQMGFSENTLEQSEFDFWGSIKEAIISVPINLKGIIGSAVDPLGLGLVKIRDKDTLAEEIGAEAALFSSIQTYFSKGKYQAYAYLLFILLYFPCVAAFGAITKEMGLAFGLLNAGYSTIVAWIVATLFFQITTGHNVFWIAFSVVLSVFIAILFYALKYMKIFKTQNLE